MGRAAARSLNVAIVAVRPSVKKEGRGGTQRHRSRREKSKVSIGLPRSSAEAPSGRWPARQEAA
jgi:hypothetical protein